MSPTEKTGSKTRRYALASLVSLGFLSLMGSAADARPATYASPQEAVDALVASAKSGNPRDIVTVLGHEGRKLASSGNEVADAAARKRFVAAYDEAHELREAPGGGPYTLYLGKDDYPFPIPIAQSAGKWWFDTAAGADEILARRIGENELSAIEVMHAYVDAQREYAEADRDGKGVQYARRLLSSDGKMDGLYWPTEEGEPESPLGPLVADARAEGYSARKDRPAPYHGYVFHVLTAQGKDASGGAQNYLVGGRMIGGFALAAIPAVYGASGIMTFIVNQDGVVYQRDLGPDTARIAGRMQTFDPQAPWQRVDRD